MNKAALIDAILQLMPASPHLAVEPARERFGALSRTELEKIHGYLVSTIDMRPPSNTRRRRWKEARSHAEDLSGFKALVTQWRKNEDRTKQWLQALQQTGPAQILVSEDAAAHSAIAPRPTDLAANQAWADAVTAAARKIRNTAETEGVNFQQLIDDLDAERSNFEFDQRIATIQLLEEEWVQAGTAPPPWDRDRLGPLADLLPWRWLAGTLRGLREVLELGEEVALDPPTVKRLTTLLTMLRPRAAAPLRLSGWEDPLGLTVVISITNAMWTFPMEYVPTWIRSELLPILDKGAKRNAEALGEESERRQITFQLQAIVRAYLLMNRIRETPPKGTVDFAPRTNQFVRTSNVSQAFVAAERAGFLSNRMSFLEPEMIVQLNHCVALITPDPETYIAQNKSLEDRSREVKAWDPFDLSLNAADVLRFAATVRPKLASARELFDRTYDAEQIAQISERYYAEAQRLATSFEKLRLYAGRYARFLLLRANLHRRLNRPGDAVSTLDAAAASVETMLKRLKACEDCPQGQQIEVETASLQFLRFAALVAKARISLPNEDEDQQIVRGLKNLIDANPHEPGAWALLLDHLWTIRRDAGAATKLIEEWITLARQRGRQDTASYLVYRRARMFYDLAEEDSRRLRTAIEAYVQVLQAQPRNVTAFEDFCDLMEYADKQMIEVLQPGVAQIIAAATPDLPQALVRVLFGLPLQPQATDPLVEALGDLVSSSSEGAAAAFGELLKEEDGWRRNVLEYASRSAYQRGRRLLDTQSLRIADRLLEGCLHARPGDVVWLSRRVDISLQQRAWTRAQTQVSAALATYPDDQILQLQESRIALLSGDTDRAEALLKKLAGPATTSTVGIELHPAVSDLLALTALKKDDFDAAEKLYRHNLEVHEFDPRGWLGYGRVAFERGKGYWAIALESWMHALTLQTGFHVSSVDRYARRTATLIGGLFREEPITSLVDQLADELKRAPETIPIMAKSLGSAGASEALVPTMRMLAESSHDIVMRRSVAQFLRARSVFAAVSQGEDRISAMVCEDVEWCRSYGVLSDYFAGAKESYSRAISRDTGALNLQGLMAHNGEPWRGSWGRLFHHITGEEMSPNYYRDSEALTREIVDASASELTRLALEIMWAILRKQSGDGLSPARLIQRLHPEKVLIPVHRLGRLDECRRPHVSAIADEDILNIAKIYMNGGSWKDNGIEMERPAERMPSVSEIHLFGLGGVFFRREAASGRGSVHISALPAWSRPAYDFEAIEMNISA